MYTLLHRCSEKALIEYNQCDPYIYIIAVNVWENNELSENRSIQMSDLKTDPRGGLADLICLQSTGPLP